MRNRNSVQCRLKINEEVPPPIVPLGVGPNQQASSMLRVLVRWKAFHTRCHPLHLRRLFYCHIPTLVAILELTDDEVLETLRWAADETGMSEHEPEIKRRHWVTYSGDSDGPQLVMFSVKVIAIGLWRSHVGVEPNFIFHIQCPPEYLLHHLPMLKEWIEFPLPCERIIPIVQRSHRLLNQYGQEYSDYALKAEQLSAQTRGYHANRYEMEWVKRMVDSATHLEACISKRLHYRNDIGGKNPFPLTEPF